MALVLVVMLDLGLSVNCDNEKAQNKYVETMTRTYCGFDLVESRFVYRSEEVSCESCCSVVVMSERVRVVEAVVVKGEE